MKARGRPPLYRRIREILESARAGAARSVNTTQVVANWLIGREIIEEEQKGRRAEYGKRVIESLAARISKDYGAGYSVQSLFYMKQFYLSYPQLCSGAPILHALRGELKRKGYAARSRSWWPGRLHPNLSWTHYRTLLRVDKAEARSFYEIEALKNNWSARELERQINSLLYERLALSRDKQGLIDNLQTFLLELGKGFAFVARQERLTLDGDHFYIDLVFYHAILKCYVIVDLKTGKLTHQDLGQLQLYVNYYDRERRTEGDNPTLGLILCADKNDAVVRYTLGPDQQRKIFASRYKLHLPSEAELRVELRREVRALAAPRTHGDAP